MTTIGGVALTLRYGLLMLLSGAAAVAAAATRGFGNAGVYLLS
jgi:hypothetical protein